jgi:hypothetical protein
LKKKNKKKDQNSPFWALSAEEMRKERFELAVILEGIVERLIIYLFK